MQIPSAETSANEIVGIIHRIAADNLPVGIRVGLVMTPPPDIKISVDNMVLDKKNLYIDQFLLQGYTRETSGTTSLTNVSGNIALDKVSGTMTATEI